MAYVFVSPEWFFGYDVALELIFAVVTLLVCFYAWKSFKLTGERNIRLFSLAFFFISLSYIVQSMLNFIIMEQFDDKVISIVHLQNVYLLNLFGIYVHAILFLIGLLLLTYIALKIYSFQTFVLLSMLVFTSLYFSPFKTFMLYLLSTVLLGFIVYYYLNNYWNNRKTTTLLVAVAMISLFVGYLFFIFAMDDSFYYVLGHILELAAYVMVLVNLLIISRFRGQKLKNGKKTG
jgi:hypothetical protein